MLVIKADGKREPFRVRNIERSLEQVGVDELVAQTIAKEIQGLNKKTIPSEEIFNSVIGYLMQYNPVWAGKYNLRKAIMQLGPTGYPFEQYVSEILRAYGYETDTNQFIRGSCVKHEIDVVARSPGHHFLIECKYHNTPGARSDLKVALYLWARFLDVKNRLESDREHPREQHGVWLITNTRCTSEAIQYAQCVGMNVTSWGYPKENSLEFMIHSRGLYPINLFPLGSQRWMYGKFAEQGLYLLKDLLRFDARDLSAKTGAPAQDIAFLQEQAKKLCQRN